MRLMLSVVAGCVVVLTGCGGGDGSGATGPLRSMRVSPETATVVSQEIRPFSVDYTGTLDVLGLIWYSDNTSIARVIGDGPTSGHVVGLTPGTATISVTATGYKTATATLTVANAGPSIWEYSTLPYIAPYTQLWGFASNAVIAIGPLAILRYDGTRWQKTPGDMGVYQPHAIWGSGAGDIYIGGRRGNLLHSLDGYGWDVVTGTGITKSIRGLWGTGPSDIYAVGEEGLVAHYDGAVWTQEAIPTTDALNDVWGSGIDDVYAVSDHAGIYRRTGGSWQEVKPPENEAFNAIWGSGPTDIYVVGTHGYVYRYDGTSWRREDIGTNATLTDVWGPTAADVYVVGEGVTFHRWAGMWRRLTFTKTMTGVWGRTANDIHFMGPEGETLHGSR